MKDEEYAEVICKKFCAFYKKGKEDLLCGSYRFLKDNVTIRELRSLSVLSKDAREFSLRDSLHDEEIRALACSKCDFLNDGCDFRENRSGPPCGGYILLTSLLVSPKSCV